MNVTSEKFGWPATLIAEFDHWLVLLRPAQPTLGSLILAARSDATAFAGLPGEAHAELKRVTGAIEAALARFTGYARLNYLMLMMVDPHVHFHIVPRYEGAREWGGVAFPDAGWPALPQLGEAVKLEPAQREALVAELKPLF